MKNAINWFEIPTRDLDKAVRFYEAVLGTAIKRENFGGVPHGVLAADQDAVTGALVADPKRQPGTTGALIYLDCRDGVPAVVERARKEGAQVVLPVTSIGPFGWIAVIRDLDGNEVGLHAEAAAS
jgi:uncharacterized protein